MATLSPVAAGCGGKSDVSSSSGAGAGTPSGGRKTAPRPAVSKRQFVAQADAICRRVNAELADSRVKGERPAELAALIVRNEAIERKAAGELARLTPPPGLASDWARLLGYRRSLATQLGEFAAAVRSGKRQFPALAKAKERLHADLLETAVHVGLKDCAKTGGG